FARCPDGAVYAAAAHGVLALADTAVRTRVLARPADAVNALYCDHRGRLLLGDRNGLAQVDRTNGGLTRLPLPVTAGASTRVTHIIEDRAGRLWLSLAGSGLLRLDGPGHGLVVPPPPSGIAGSLPGGEIATLFLDRSGLLWVGTLSHGAAWTDPEG